MTDTDQNAGGGYADELRDHQFDGIQEFDNHLPNWWLWTFYGACIFSLFYWLHFHVVGSGALPLAQYEQEKQEWDEKLAQLDTAVSADELVAMSKDPEVVAAGAVTWLTCAGCHAQDGGARIAGADLPGVNLTDDAWLHGGRPEQIYQTVLNGVDGTAMQAFVKTIGARKVQEVVAYMLAKVKGTNVEGGKPPQGVPEEPAPGDAGAGGEQAPGTAPSGSGN
ncbi:MAG: c-type cytochrome [Planctomycetes bacterium]|nr:c-type cytochrome [Planctomycetota bacterium]